MIIQSFGTPLSASMIYDDISRMGEVTSDFFWGENAPVQQYHGLMVDIEQASETVNNELENLCYCHYGYPPDAYGNYRYGWLNTILTILNMPEMAKIIEDSDWKNIEDGDDEEDMFTTAGAGKELRRCIAAANTLTKKQMLEIFPKVCTLMISFMEKRTAFEVIDEILREINLHNTRLNKANKEGDNC